MTREKLIKQLRLRVVCPTKAKVEAGRKTVTLVNSNYRYLGIDELSLWDWVDFCRNAASVRRTCDLRRLPRGGESEAQPGVLTRRNNATTPHEHEREGNFFEHAETKRDQGP